MNINSMERGQNVVKKKPPGLWMNANLCEKATSL